METGALEVGSYILMFIGGSVILNLTFSIGLYAYRVFSIAKIDTILNDLDGIVRKGKESEEKFDAAYAELLDKIESRPLAKSGPVG